MTNDFYCDEALSGRTPVKIVRETGDVLPRSKRSTAVAVLPPILVDTRTPSTCISTSGSEIRENETHLHGAKLFAEALRRRINLL